LGKRIAYVAQSAAASFNPAHQLIEQHVEAPVQHGVSARSESAGDGVELYRKLRLPNPMVLSCIASYACRTLMRSAFGIRIRYLVGSCSAR